MPLDAETVRFGRFTLDTKRRSLLFDDKQVLLHSKALDVLIFLVRNHDRPVPYSEILAIVWHNRAISENNLSVQISSLRKAIADAGEPNPLIITLPERCYRFIGEIERPRAAPDLTTQQTASPPPPATTATPAAPKIRRASRPTILAAATLAIIATIGAARFFSAPAESPPRLSMVVLPFRNSGPDHSQDYLADAITDDLTADLAHVPASTVIARQSAEAVKTETPQEIGKALKVRYILSGSILPEDSTYHITAMLTDTATSQEVWAAQFDPARNRLSEVRDDIARHIASPLHIALDRIESANSVRDRPNNPDATDLFFRARSILDSDMSLNGYQRAQALLEMAIKREPNFVEAKTELAWRLLHKAISGDDPDDIADVNRARFIIREVSGLAPDNSNALAAQAMLSRTDGNCSAARSEANRALMLEPSNMSARQILASCDADEGHLDEAASEYLEILRIDPLSASSNVINLTVGTIKLVQGSVKDAISLLRRISIDESQAVGDLGPAEQAQLLLIAARELNGEHEDARKKFESYAARFKGRSVFRIETYFKPAWRKLPGFAKLMAALVTAGMPEFADESVVGSDPNSCNAGDFASTPLSIPGGSVISTEQLVQKLQRPDHPLVLDVGRGVNVPPDWRVYDPSKTLYDEEQFALQEALTLGKPYGKHSIVVLGAGVRGCLAYRAALLLLHSGFTGTQWYRGGEEAWAHSLSLEHVHVQ